ncbi:MAG: NifU family protein [Sulfurovum sp.]|nr:MAG: NifU family protein [Sulfurovum sp.]
MTFSDRDIFEAVKYHLPTVNEYVTSHGGKIKLLGTHNGTIYIALSGECHGCAMSFMTTKMVVQKKLRELIHPELIVINVDGTPENALPDTYYTEEDEAQTKNDTINQTRFIDKIKHFFKKKTKT